MGSEVAILDREVAEAYKFEDKVDPTQVMLSTIAGSEAKVYDRTTVDFL